MVKKISIFGVALATLVIVPATFAASPPVVAGYHGVAGQVQNTIKPSSVAATHVSRTLPFTGANLAMFAVAAAILVVLGFGFRRLSRRPTGPS